MASRFSSPIIPISRDLSRALRELKFSAPITHVYNPLEYARAPHERYLELYGQGKKRLLFLGMNPGPWGMVQTGVPFGEVNLVRDWLKVSGPVEKAPSEHPARPILGFACKRSEVSGQRFWGWARDRWGKAENFFKEAFVWNYCPLAFMVESGKNYTPDMLKTSDREALFEACDKALGRIVESLNCDLVIGLGRFAEERAQEALQNIKVKTAYILHPSPNSPAANRGWAQQSTAQLEKIGAL